MERYELMMRSSQYAWGAFIFAFGACVGSLINVLVYRMPLGLDVVTPSSRCPRCATKLRWNDNIPIFGWLFLRGRCRYCRTPISPEYPLVEFLAACLFLGLFVLWYTLPSSAVWLGLDWGALRPDWARIDLFDHAPRSTWPVFTVYIALVGSLLAMTLVDAKTFTIPLAIPWTATIVALVFHTVHAFTIDMGWMRWPIIRFSDWPWALPTYAGDAGWSVFFGSLAGVLGIVASLLLLKLGVITRSFGEQYDAWEKAELAKRPDAADDEPDDDPLTEPDFSAPYAILLTVGITLITGAIGTVVAPVLGYQGWHGLFAGLLLGPWVGAIVQRVRSGPAESPEEDDESDAELWIRYPHARAEMVREMAFLALPVVLFYLGFTFGPKLAASAGWEHLPLTLQVLGGVLLGYLIGGAVVWAIRIFGSLAFGKEAMGLGDAHLMAAVGACTGWIDATIAFFGAAFVGIYWTITSLISGRVDRAMPYGPYLAIATVLVIVGKPAVEAGLSQLTAGPVSLP